MQATDIATTPSHGYSYQSTLAASHKASWLLDDVIGGEQRLDFTKPFMPESLAWVTGMEFLSSREKLILNQIRGHAYLCIFGLVEEFILPFVLDHARTQLDTDDFRTRAFLQFAGEEAKHIHLFKRFRDAFRQGFGVECAVIGPPAEIAKAVLSHQPLAVALLILHIEWLTQRHYLAGVRNDQELDPLFKSMLKHHWMEEAQHAKLDTLMVEALAAPLTAQQIDSAVGEYLEIGGFLDNGLKMQTQFDLEALERATCKTLSPSERAQFIAVQHQANRWTYIGTGMTHPNFLTTVGGLLPAARERLQQVAPAFC